MIALIGLIQITQSIPMTCADFSSISSTLQIISDETFWVVGPNYPNGTYASVLLNKISPDPYTGGIHIWETPSRKANQGWFWLKFNKTFEVPNKNIKAAIIYFNVDDRAKFYLNNVFTECSNDAWIPEGPKICDVTPFVKTGLNNFTVEALEISGSIHLSFRLEIIMLG